jgi:chromosome partitioning protein
MKVVGLLSQKGGAGKSTFACHLAVAACAAGYNAGIIDLDPQQTLCTWGDKRGKPPDVASGQAARLSHMLLAARTNGADLVFIDTAPAADQAAAIAAKAADLILIPCRPAAFDLEAMSTTLDLARAAQRLAITVLNAVPPRGPASEEARAAITAAGGHVGPYLLTQRAAYAHGVIDGRTAQEYEPEGRAAVEIARLYMWVCGIVGLPAYPQAAMEARDDTTAKSVRGR